MNSDTKNVLTEIVKNLNKVHIFPGLTYDPEFIIIENPDVDLIKNYKVIIKNIIINDSVIYKPKRTNDSVIYKQQPTSEQMITNSLTILWEWLILTCKSDFISPSIHFWHGFDGYKYSFQIAIVAIKKPLSLD